jgi:glycerate dehydrogenase
MRTGSPEAVTFRPPAVRRSENRSLRDSMNQLVRGVFLDIESIHPQDLDLAALRDCLAQWTFFDATPVESIGERIAGAQVVVTNKVPLSGEQLRAAHALRLVCLAATGADRIDVASAQRAGIVVSNARNYATASVAEAVFALLLTLVRQLDSYRRQVAEGLWCKSPHFCLFDTPIEELSGKTLGIIGYGVLGRAVAQRATAFGMRVQVAQRLYGDPVEGRVSLAEMLATSDVVSLHCPLSAVTRNLIGGAELRSMKRSAILINTARGGIVDEQALVTALEQGWIAGAGIDVLSEEPPPPDSPLLKCHSPGLILTPHIAWASRGARQRLVSEIVDNICAFQRGEPRNSVL